MGGQGGGEGVGVGEFVVGAEFGGGAGEVQAGVDEFDGELADIFDDFAGDAEFVKRRKRILHRGPQRHRGHREEGEKDEEKKTKRGPSASLGMTNFLGWRKWLVVSGEW